MSTVTLGRYLFFFCLLKSFWIIVKKCVSFLENGLIEAGVYKFSKIVGARNETRSKVLYVQFELSVMFG